MEQSELKVPNPGSQAAVELGCVCPILDNAHGMGYMGVPGAFVYDGNCPVHVTVSVADSEPSERPLEGRLRADADLGGTTLAWEPDGTTARRLAWYFREDADDYLTIQYLKPRLGGGWMVKYSTDMTLDANDLPLLSDEVADAFDML